jgi:catechol 2,3-dioxygenase-like lactoylglutathione lyase family enzyme
MTKHISGIQQMGIGIPNVHEAWKWYRAHLAIDVPIFEEAATAGLMLPYTGGKPQDRHAILALSMQGGGGFEIWQYTSRVPQAAVHAPVLGDLGIYICKIKSNNIQAAWNLLHGKGVALSDNIETNPAGQRHFFIADPYDNIFEIIESDTFFVNDQKPTGGVFGAVIGVSSIEDSLKLYADVLGYSEIVFDENEAFSDFKCLNNGEQRFRRVLLRHPAKRQGAFSELLGPSEIELVQAVNYQPRKIFQNRFWGDLGFIHLCFDVNNMKALKELCESNGFPFTVDSANSFDMGEAAGHFTYIEDPDGALIEFVETHKIPILKKIGWYLNLQKRNPLKPLPKWMLKSLSLNRKKD